MKIAISIHGNDISAQIDPRFGRCESFLVVDTSSMESRAVPNGGLSASGGAGIQAAQTVIDTGVNAVITGNIGPNAFQVLSTAGITVYTGAIGSAIKAIEELENGNLMETTSPNVNSHAGIGGGNRQRAGGR